MRARFRNASYVKLNEGTENVNFAQSTNCNTFRRERATYIWRPPSLDLSLYVWCIAVAVSYKIVKSEARFKWKSKISEPFIFNYLAAIQFIWL